LIKETVLHPWIFPSLSIESIASPGHVSQNIAVIEKQDAPITTAHVAARTIFQCSSALAVSAVQKFRSPAHVFNTFSWNFGSESGIHHP
jgi:hypothetical protein